MDTLGIILAMLLLLFLWLPEKMGAECHRLYNDFTKGWHDVAAQYDNTGGAHNKGETE